MAVMHSPFHNRTLPGECARSADLGGLHGEATDAATALLGHFLTVGRTVAVTTSMEGIAASGDVAVLVLVLVRDAVRPRRLLVAEASE
jgi:hypothetical protein